MSKYNEDDKIELPLKLAERVEMLESIIEELDSAHDSAMYSVPCDYDNDMEMEFRNLYSAVGTALESLQEILESAQISIEIGDKINSNRKKKV